MRRSPQKAAALQSLAKRLGRTKADRGKEPTWVSPFPLYPLSIPDHGGGKDLANGTKNSILNQLEDDILAWDERLSSNGHTNDDGDDNG